MDFNQAKRNMIDSQLRTWDVIDQQVLDTFLLIDRQEFTPKKYEKICYGDVEIPIGAGQVMLTPKLAGRLVQELEIVSSDKILEIGTGTGYITAILSYLGEEVNSVEINRDLHFLSQKVLSKYSRGNIKLRLGDGLDGSSDSVTYDAILLTGSLPVLTDSLKYRLAIGGRLLGVIGDPPIMSATLITRRTEVDFEENKVFETSIPSLKEQNKKPVFQF